MEGILKSPLWLPDRYAHLLYVFMDLHAYLAENYTRSSKTRRLEDLVSPAKSPVKLTTDPRTEHA